MSDLAYVHPLERPQTLWRMSGGMLSAHSDGIGGWHWRMANAQDALGPLIHLSYPFIHEGASGEMAKGQVRCINQI